MTLLTNIAWGTISKLLASVLGILISIASLIPLPRFTQWCPPMIPLFDGMIALAVGMILYVLILWAWVSWFGTVSFREIDKNKPGRENRCVCIVYHAKNTKFWRTLCTNSGSVTNYKKISFPEFQPSTGRKAFVRMNFYFVLQYISQI